MRALLLNWPTARILRLVFAVIFLAAGISRGDMLAYLIAGVFGIQAVFNVGCSGGTCASPASTSSTSDIGEINDVSYEEVR